MEKNELLLLFFTKVINDQKITKTHMAVYMALYYLWSRQQFVGTLSVFSWQIMPIAKISTSSMYYTTIKQLHEYGYIDYKPSFYGKRGSTVNFQTKIFCKQ